MHFNIIENNQIIDVFRSLEELYNFYIIQKKEYRIDIISTSGIVLSENHSIKTLFGE